MRLPLFFKWITRFLGFMALYAELLPIVEQIIRFAIYVCGWFDWWLSGWLCWAWTWFHIGTPLFARQRFLLTSLFSRTVKLLSENSSSLSSSLSSRLFQEQWTGKWKKKIKNELHLLNSMGRGVSLDFSLVLLCFCIHCFNHWCFLQTRGV